MPQMLVWNPWRIISSAPAGRAGSVSASALATSHCRRVHSPRPLCIALLPGDDCYVGTLSRVGCARILAEVAQQRLLILQKFDAERIARARERDAHLALHHAGMRRHDQHA